MTDLLECLCDLTHDQYRDLCAARRGQRIPNGARRVAFTQAGLLESNGTLTDYGQRLLERAAQVAHGGREAPLVQGFGLAFLSVDATQASRRLSKDGMPWMRSAHIKVLISLAHLPGQAHGWLCTVFAPQTVSDLQANGLIAGEARRGSPYHLTEAGITLLGRLAGVPAPQDTAAIERHTAAERQSQPAAKPVHPIIECPYCRHKQAFDPDNDSFVCDACDEIFFVEEQDGKYTTSRVAE